MARAVIYMNSRNYADNQKQKSGEEFGSLRRNVADEVVDWLNSLPGTKYQGKKIKEIVNFQIEGRNLLWECFALVELEN